MYTDRVKVFKPLKNNNLNISIGPSLLLSLCLTACSPGAGVGTDKSDGNSGVTSVYNFEAPIAYVKRPVTIPADAVSTDEVTSPLGNPRNSFTFDPGGNLYIRETSLASATETNVTGDWTQLDVPAGTDIEGDVSDPDVSYDGTKVIFSMKEGAFENPGMRAQPTWNIWEYNVVTKTLHRVIGADLIAEKGNDYDPHYLPDGRIVFTSDRQATTSGFNLEYGFSVEPSLDEDRNEPTASLHVMNSDGSGITQISFNQSHDLNPSVLNSGKIVFSRWENTGSNDQFDIFAVNPDGSEMRGLYGSQSHTASGSADVFLNPREMPDGRLISTLLPATGAFTAGELVFIDYQNYVDIDVPRAGSASSQAAGQVSATGGQVPVTAALASKGRYATPYPLWDGTNRILASYSPCLVQAPLPADALEDDINRNPLVPCGDGRETYVAPQYPISYVVLIDFDTQTQYTIAPPELNMVMEDPVALIDRSTNLPVIIPDKTVANGGLDGSLNTGMGAIKIRSVYDTRSFTDIGLAAVAASLPCMGGVPCVATTATVTGTEANVDFPTLAATDINTLPVRFARIIVPMPNPDDNNLGQARGGAGNRMLAIAGYAPVEPDGSVYTEVPADVPFKIELVDASGQRYSTSGSWLQVRPGEVIECNGCHDTKDGSPARNAGAVGSGTMVLGGGGIFSAVNPNMVYDVGDLVGANSTDDFIPTAGMTMAEARVAKSCVEDGFCTARRLLSDMVYEEVWPMTAVVGLEADISLQYKDSFIGDIANMLTNNPFNDDGLYSVDHRVAPTDETLVNSNYPILNAGPVSATTCIGDISTIPVDRTDRGDWTSQCRIVINYKAHIQPMLERTRMTPDPASPSTLIDHRCTTCHSKLAADGVTLQIPAGARQLDFNATGTITVTRVNNIAGTNSDTVFSNYNDNWTLSYNEFLRPNTKFVLEIVGTNFQIVQRASTATIPDPADPTLTITVPDTEDTPISAGGVISTFNSRNSYLIYKMTSATPTAANRTRTAANDADYYDHTLMMTRAEIRLLREWIDTGAHYYNNPFGYTLP